MLHSLVWLPVEMELFRRHGASPMPTVFPKHASPPALLVLIRPPPTLPGPLLKHLSVDPSPPLLPEALLPVPVPAVSHLLPLRPRPPHVRPLSLSLSMSSSLLPGVTLSKSRVPSHSLVIGTPLVPLPCPHHNSQPVTHSGSSRLTCRPAQASNTSISRCRTAVLSGRVTRTAATLFQVALPLLP